MFQKLYQTIKSSIAQIVLGYILLPLVCGFLSLLNHEESETLVNFFVGLFSDILIIEYITDAITLYLTNSQSAEQQLILINSLVNLTPWDLVMAVGVGMWAGIFSNLTKLIGFKGIPVLQSILAVGTTCLLTDFVAAYSDTLYRYMFLGFTCVCNIVLTILTSEKKILALALGLSTEVVASIFATAYVVLLVLIMQGATLGFWTWLGLQLCLVVPMTFFLVATVWLKD